MHQLRILFTCLCAYLPRQNEVLVVIPDGRKGHASHSGHAGHGGSAPVPPHVSVIELDPTDLSPQSQIQPDLTFRRPGARRDRGLVFLTGNDIRLDPAPTGAPTLRGGRVAGTKVPGSAAEAEDFTWIADIATLDAAAGVIDPACIAAGTDAPKDGNKRVVARVNLQGGTLGAQLLARDAKSSSHDIIKFDFADATALANTRTDCSQALAAGVAYDLAVLSEEVALVITPFGGTERRLVFSFAGVPTGGTIELRIKNMPLEGVLELTDTIRPGEQTDVDSHFAIYYTLSTTPPQTPWVPRSLKARLGGPICPGARFTE